MLSVWASQEIFFFFSFSSVFDLPKFLPYIAPFSLELCLPQPFRELLDRERPLVFSHLRISVVRNLFFF